MHILAFLFLLIFTLTFQAFSQIKTENHILSPTEQDYLLPTKTKTKLGIRFPIIQTYQYVDELGTHLLVLTERKNSINGNIIQNDSIKAFNLLLKDDDLEIAWQLTDYLGCNENLDFDEKSIWFWTKFVELKDLDSDGQIDPILVYGTKGLNGTDDGRIKIVIYYKDNKSLIRHQNAVLDFHRNTMVNASFYRLPEPIKKSVYQIMQRLRNEKLAIYPESWENKISK